MGLESKRDAWLWLPALTLVATIAACRGSAVRFVSVQPADEAAAIFLAYRVADGNAAKSPVLEVMHDELNRSMRELSKRSDEPPYFLAYEVTDIVTVKILSVFGALYSSTQSRVRVLDVDLRVGSPELDNTRRLPGSSHSPMASQAHGQIEMGEDPAALKVALWLYTDAAHKAAVEQLARVQADKRVGVDSYGKSADFSAAQPVQFHEAPAVLDVDRAEWERKLRDFSRLFREYPSIVDGAVELTASAATRYLVTSEGTSLQLAEPRARLTFYATARLDDGTDLTLHDYFNATTGADLPAPPIVRERVRSLLDQLMAMREAPTAEPFAGPAILEGRAAAVFFHETLGHRLEGHRQKDEREGQTFTGKVGETITAEFISVFDDPRAFRFGGADLNGHYLFDHEGVPAKRVDLITRGVLRGFLMSRSPIEGFDSSNGHGRRQPGRAVVARQGNLVVQAEGAISPAQLRERLIGEIQKQGKPYGLIFRNISGGFATTQRAGVQAFKVQPMVVYRFYSDGREELVRGVDFEGTPLTALSKIIAAADDYAIFNGYCGAESGLVPVAAISPSVLVEEIEVTRKMKGQERPPVLPPPEPEGRQ